MAFLDFSESDHRILKQVIADILGNRVNYPSRTSGNDFVLGDDHQAPETYVAKSPSGGITGLTLADTGTGSGTAPEDDRPGSAICDIYLIRDDSISGVPEMVPVNQLDKLVYNVSTSQVDGNIWFSVVRDKFGTWLANVSGSSGVCDTVRFKIVSVDSATRTGLGTIQSRPVGCSDLPLSTVGGTVIPFCDPDGCFLNEPDTGTLIGRAGGAHYMQPIAAPICQPGGPPYTAHWEVAWLCCDLINCN